MDLAPTHLCFKFTKQDNNVLVQMCLIIVRAILHPKINYKTICHVFYICQESGRKSETGKGMTAMAANLFPGWY